ncbi:ROK family protein [Geovibrio thiophilus]|nr:ROK family protein [Geovibrio thiophilus]
MKYACFDIGATNLKMGVVDENGIFLEYESEKTPYTYEELIKRIRDFSLGNSCSAVGIGIPGNVSDGSAYCPNLPVLNGHPLETDIEALTELPVSVENDANLAALGEYIFFETESTGNMILLTLGTGVGGGLILDGTLVTSESAAFEVGHITLNFNGEKCGCGKRGCFEYYCSMNGLVRSYNELSADVKFLKAADVYKQFKIGDKVAELAFDKYANSLAHGMASIANLFAPLKIKIGGGLSEMSDAYLHTAVKVFSKIVFPALKDKVVIETAAAKNRAGLLGAAALCMVHG